ncbi:hypothetical protein DPMN_098155 [Dreissena polymorpha]|uniref:Uncharacterized protein n=1 Tax=Dreissena polymorpha TaxID=45954 RepID=A0A9D4R581_DREPO|nr:hypothetical protein DPMN_098155 [Dreissena polymorpha]
MSKPDKKRKKEVNSTGSVSEIDNELTADQHVERDEEKLKDIVNELFEKVKEDFVKFLTKQIEVLESRIFDKEVENDKLKKKIKTLTSEVNHQTEENEKLKSDIANYDSNRRKLENESNQYSRSSNIIISGVEQVNRGNEFNFETAEETTKLIVAKINSIANENLTAEDIDIAHRLKKGPSGKKDIIARFKSRITRNRILRQGKVLRSQNIFVSEDLTPLNLEVFNDI